MPIKRKTYKQNYVTLSLEVASKRKYIKTILWSTSGLGRKSEFFNLSRWHLGVCLRTSLSLSLPLSSSFSQFLSVFVCGPVSGCVGMWAKAEDWMIENSKADYKPTPLSPSPSLLLSIYLSIFFLSSPLFFRFWRSFFLYRKWKLCRRLSLVQSFSKRLKKYKG